MNVYNAFWSYLPYPTHLQLLLDLYHILSSPYSFFYKLIESSYFWWYVPGYRVIWQSKGNLPGVTSLKKTDYIKSNFYSYFVVNDWRLRVHDLPRVIWAFSVNMVLNS